MPTAGGFWYGFWEKNPRLWDSCKKRITAQMVAEGWKTYANKFDRVMTKRAMKLFYTYA